MTIPLIINGTTYNYPETRDIRWGPTATAWASAVTSGMLQKAGGTFTLLADVNFGPNFGLYTKFLGSRAADVAESGIVRLGNTESVTWRNGSDDGDIALSVNASDELVYNGQTLGIFSVGDTSTINMTNTDGLVTSDIIAGSITNSLINSAAAIARSKLASGSNNYVVINSGAGVMSEEATLAATRGGLATDASAFTGLVKAAAGVFSAATLVNADVSASAAIARSKLASGSNNYVLINSGAGVMSEEATLAASRGGLATDASAFTGVVKASSGVFSAATVVNADVSASAAIARSKLASGSNNYVVINSGAGVMSEEAQLAGSRGGSGVSNSGTFTWGSNNITFTTGGTTGVTLPTTGTLATLAGSETFTNKTLTSPAINGGTIGSAAISSGTVTSASIVTCSIPAASTTVGGGITLAEGTNNGANKVNLKAADSIGSDFDFTLPATAGNSGEVLTSAGASATPTWTAPLVNPMDGVGQFIIGNTGGAAIKFAHPGAANYMMNTTSATGVSWTTNPTVATITSTGTSVLNAVTVTANMGSATLSTSGLATLASAAVTGNLTVATSQVIADTANSKFGIGRATLNTSGARVQVDGTAPVAEWRTTDGNSFSISSYNSSGAGAGAEIDLRRSRNATLGSQTVVQSGDELGAINFAGSDGTVFRNAAVISCLVDATPGSSDMPGVLKFWTTPDGAATPLERMYIDNSGQVAIGTANPKASGQALVVATTGADDCTLVKTTSTNTNTDGNYALVVQKGSTTNTSGTNRFVRFLINAGGTGSGYIGSAGASAAAFFTASDVRLKKNIVNIDGALSKINALRPVEFDFIDDTGHQIGFIAQEIREVFPDAVAEDPRDGMLSVGGWSKELAFLVGAIKELDSKLEAALARIATLEGEK